MAVTYTFKTYANQTLSSGFGQYKRDAGNATIQVPSGIQTVDATPTSPVASPATVADNSVTTINVPINAVIMWVLFATNTCNMSEADNTVQSKYVPFPTGVWFPIPCVRMAEVYFEANSGNSTMSFYFEVI
jgi:hypothetical protein